MANASSFLIAANDEHGLNPPTIGKRTPFISYINRSFYENEFNRQAKIDFMLACLRCGFNVYDVHPEIQDVSVSTRVVRTNRARPTLVVTFAYNASGTGLEFTQAKGLEVYYSLYNEYASRSRTLSQDVFNNVLARTNSTPRQIGTLSVGMLSNVNCPATLIEAGFMTNFEEAKLMLNPIFTVNVGEGACAGVCQFLDVPYVERKIENYPLLRQGNEGNSVVMLQYLLNEYGYNLVPDGKFGANTLKAVQSFQANNSLTQDGVVGPLTWSALLNLNPSQYVLRRGSRRSAVLFLQRLLLSFLYLITNLDGVFGPETERAVIAFQQENGLTPDGIVGRNTWNKLLSSSGRPQP